MATFIVSVPFTGTMSFEVKAANPEEAKQKALDSACSIKVDEGENMDIEDFELHEYVTRGNVFYGCSNEVEVIECDEDDDD